MENKRALLFSQHIRIRSAPVSRAAPCRSTSAFLLAVSSKVLLLLDFLVSHFVWLPSRTFLLFRRHLPPPHKSPCRLSYLLMMFLQRPSSFRMSATSWRRAAFSRSRKAARTEIWFSFSRRASRERLAASLFLARRFQYFSSCYQHRCLMLGCVGRKVGRERQREERNEKGQ